MIYVVLQDSLIKSRYDDKPPMPAEVEHEHSVTKLPHLPRIGDIVQVYSDVVQGQLRPQYREITGVVHDIRDEDVDIYLIVRKYDP